MARILWRILMAVLCACLILFAAAQYNDPDPQIWAVVYSIGAIWTGAAAFAPRLIAGRAATLLLLISVTAALCAVVYFWPAHPNWWRQEVWWHDEEAREGMGMMILAACIALVGGYRLLAPRV
jgi:Na+/melibiose symporter-like transporter